MFSAFQTFGKLGALASSVARAWSPLALWPDGIATPGMWISPRTLTSEWQDYTGTTPVATPGTVADSSNPVGLALDIRAGATVLTDPGNHMSRSTSVDRPLLSALHNFVLEKAVTPLSSSADMTGANAGGAAVSFSAGVNTLTRQAGTSSYVRWDKSASFSFQGIDANVPITFTYSIKGVGSSVGKSFALKLIRNSTVTDYVTLTEDWVTVNVACPVGHTTIYAYFLLFGDSSTTNVAVGESVEIKNLQVNYGSALPYQAVASASSYSSTGFPIAQLYNGTNSSMATAAFAAGTLVSGMDCMIAVRRDANPASMICGLYKTAGDPTKYFGEASASPGPYLCFAGCGSPTVWVDGVQLAGGTSVTISTLNAALTVADFHILEFQGLDLSAWSSAMFGCYGTGYAFLGARGDILLFPSTASTEDKDAARQWLADYYGVTLP